MSVSIVPTLKILKPAFLIVGGGLAGLVVGYWVNVLFFPGLAPEQPIAFSHKVHAGENEIPCQYCHIYARRSISAGVPSVNKCVGCHQSVAADRPTRRSIFRAQPSAISSLPKLSRCWTRSRNCVVRAEDC